MSLAPIGPIVFYFSEVEDPRRDNRRHLLLDIIVIAICGADTWTDPVRNEEIRAERLSPEEIVALERADPARFESLQKKCAELIRPEFCHTGCNHLFHCGAGTGSFNVGYDGTFRLCSSLWHPDCVYDLRQGSLQDAWEHHVPRVRDRRSDRREFLETCRRCPAPRLTFAPWRTHGRRRCRERFSFRRTALVLEPSPSQRGSNPGA